MRSSALVAKCIIIRKYFILQDTLDGTRLLFRGGFEKHLVHPYDIGTCLAQSGTIGARTLAAR